MILVDIQAPMLERVYDFELDEEMGVGEAVEDIVTLISLEEQIFKGDSGAMLLYALRQGVVLRRDESFNAQGVREGDRLILI